MGPGGHGEGGAGVVGKRVGRGEKDFRVGWGGGGECVSETPGMVGRKSPHSPAQAQLLPAFILYRMQGYCLLLLSQ